MFLTTTQSGSGGALEASAVRFQTVSEAQSVPASQVLQAMLQTLQQQQQDQQDSADDPQEVENNDDDMDNTEDCVQKNEAWRETLTATAEAVAESSVLLPQAEQRDELSRLLQTIVRQQRPIKVEEPTDVAPRLKQEESPSAAGNDATTPIKTKPAAVHADDEDAKKRSAKKSKKSKRKAEKKEQKRAKKEKRESSDSRPVVKKEED